MSNTESTAGRSGTQVGTKVDGVVKVLCGRKQVRVFMTPQTFSEIPREKGNPYSKRMCIKCEEIGTRLYFPKPRITPEKAQTPSLF